MISLFPEQPAAGRAERTGDLSADRREGAARAERPERDFADELERELDAARTPEPSRRAPERETQGPVAAQGPADDAPSGDGADAGAPRVAAKEAAESSEEPAPREASPEAKPEAAPKAEEEAEKPSKDAGAPSAPTPAVQGLVAAPDRTIVAPAPARQGVAPQDAGAASAQEGAAAASVGVAPGPVREGAAPEGAGAAPIALDLKGAVAQQASGGPFSAATAEHAKASLASPNAAPAKTALGGAVQAAKTAQDPGAAAAAPAPRSAPSVAPVVPTAPEAPDAAERATLQPPIAEFASAKPKAKGARVAPEASESGGEPRRVAQGRGPFEAVVASSKSAPESGRAAAPGAHLEGVARERAHQLDLRPASAPTTAAPASGAATAQGVSGGESGGAKGQSAGPGGGGTPAPTAQPALQPATRTAEPAPSARAAEAAVPAKTEAAPHAPIQAQAVRMETAPRAAPPAPAAAALATSDAEVLEQVSRMAIRSNLGERGEVTLRLHPAELGSVRVKLEFDDRGVRGVLSAENKDVAAILGRGLGDLQTALADRGVHVAALRVEVDAGAAGRDQRDPAQRQAFARPEGERERGRGALDERGERRETARPRRWSGGGLSLIA